MKSHKWDVHPFDDRIVAHGHGFTGMEPIRCICLERTPDAGVSFARRTQSPMETAPTHGTGGRR